MDAAVDARRLRLGRVPRNVGGPVGLQALEGLPVGLRKRLPAGSQQSPISVIAEADAISRPRTRRTCPAADSLVPRVPRIQRSRTSATATLAAVRAQDEGVDVRPEVLGRQLPGGSRRHAAGQIEGDLGAGSGRARLGGQLLDGEGDARREVRALGRGDLLEGEHDSGHVGQLRDPQGRLGQAGVGDVGDRNDRDAAAGRRREAGGDLRVDDGEDAPGRADARRAVRRRCAAGIGGGERAGGKKKGARENAGALTDLRIGIRNRSIAELVPVWTGRSGPDRDDDRGEAGLDLAPHLLLFLLLRHRLGRGRRLVGRVGRAAGPGAAAVSARSRWRAPGFPSGTAWRFPDPARSAGRRRRATRPTSRRSSPRCPCRCSSPSREIPSP